MIRKLSAICFLAYTSGALSRLPLGLTRLAKRKIPQRVVLSEQVLHSSRLKKARASTVAQVGAAA
jgi:hypothetical protein